MTTVDESGKVLNGRRLALAKELGIPYEQVTDAQYNLYKAALHARHYGMGAQTFAQWFARNTSTTTGRQSGREIATSNTPKKNDAEKG